MRIGTVVTSALVAVGVAMTTTGIGHAEPTPVHAQQAVDAPPSLRGIDKGLAYEVSATEDRRSVVTTLDAGRFELVHDGQVVTVTDRDGDVIAALPMVVRADEHAVPLAPEIDETGTRLTLTPIGESETPLRDISAQERFFAETQRLQPQIIEGAVIGAAIGFVLGFPLGLFVLDFITVPVATVAGAAIGALAGYALAGGQPAIDTALAYVTGAP
ncbi:hypothetical protein BOX37_29215 [Nocardia mangyaensis]|uniref:DUF8020 domain-containing protein n=1 Tax=Nocardia mangyaensis TaxID=2213200 RepID=A0A1J0VZ47_9NOCA|nr:hypothetical protein [Nocardia mangyaensis]APE37339.1 hypothetical protein BOX37_29215 [Nocardia mangyaensis]